MTSAARLLSGIAVLTPVLFVGAGFAQDDGGRRISVDLSQRLEGETNVDLDPDDEDGALISTTRLGFGLRTATPTTALGLRFGLSYREDFEDEDSGDLEGPNASLNYNRLGANSSFTFGTSYDSQEVEYLDALDLLDFLDEDGEIPVDLSELEDDRERTGTRRSLRFDTALAYGTDGPYGVTFRLSGQDISYSDLSDASTLEDASSLNTSVTGRVDLNPVLSASTTLRYRWAEEGEDREETAGLGLGLDYRQPVVTYGASFDVNRVDGDTRLGISGRIARSFPAEGQLNLSLGLVQTANDDLIWNGSASYNQPLSRLSAVNVGFRRAVSNDPDEGETTNSVLSAGYNRSLTRLTSFGLTAQVARSEDLDIDETDTSARVSATVSRRLTPDWSVTGGLSHTMRDEGDEDRATSDAVFVQIGRSFQSPF